MANPAKLTVRTIVGNNALAWPAADTIDTTGTVPVVAADMGGEADRVALLVTARGAVSARVAAGDLPPAVRQPLGDLSLPLASALAASVLINPAGANNDVLYTANVAGVARQPAQRAVHRSGVAKPGAAGGRVRAPRDPCISGHGRGRRDHEHGCAGDCSGERALVRGPSGDGRGRARL